MSIASAMRLAAMAVILFMSVFGPIIENALRAIAVLGKLSEVWDKLTGSMSTGGEAANAAGANVGGGFADGILGALPRVIDAATQLGAGALSAIQSFLGIASPSRVMMEQGGHTAAGFAEGVDAGAPEAHAAVGNLGNAKPGGAKGVGARGVTINGGVHYHGSREDFPDFEIKVIELFERAANGGPSPEPAGA
jgi:hypothetical protein